MVRAILLVGLLLGSVACQESLLQEVNQREATLAVFNLDRAGIPAQKRMTGSGWQVLVERKHLPQATAVLTTTGLLKPKVENAPASRSLLLSQSERDHWLEVATAERIEETLETLPGVLEARVHLFRQGQSVLRQGKPPSRTSASAVLIVADPFSLATEAIARIIQGAVAIEPANIEVVVVKDSRFAAPKAAEELPSTMPPERGSLAFDPQARSVLASVLLLGTALALLAVLLHLRSVRRNAFRAKLRAASGVPKQQRDLDSELMTHRQAISQNGVMQ